MNGAPVSPADPDSIRLLVVEDDEDMQELLLQVFAENPDYASQVEIADSLAAALTRIEADELDAVMVDLGLPDSAGLRTVKRIIDAIDDHTAVVVLTGERDTQMAAAALSLGAQDYVVKDDLSPQLCTRVVRYGVTRVRLIRDLESARKGQERERELRRLERMSQDTATTGVSAHLLGAMPVSERLGPRNAELVVEYSRILDEALDAQAYRGANRVQSDLRSLAGVLGFLGAGPRDVIELHTRCLRAHITEVDPVRASAAIEEARVIVLQLMGHLVSHYRGRSLGGRPSAGSELRRSSAEPTAHPSEGDTP